MKSSIEKIALAHHWLVSQRGGENVFAEFCRIFPKAPIYTLLKAKNMNALDPAIAKRNIHTSFLGRLPLGHKIYKLLLPLYPSFVGSIDVKDKFDILLSSDASVLKGMRKAKNVKQICYCHSPPRYIWDLSEEYINSFNWLKASLFKACIPYLRRFDLLAAKNVDYFIANSTYVQKRIKETYDRESVVIYPPVDLKDFTRSNESDDYFLIVSALVPYKRIDLAVDAFSKADRKLVIIGDGSELQKLKKRAPDNVKFLGRQPKSVLVDHYKKCKAFVFPGVEDFGITPLEAQACGKPVIAYAEGGALETVIDNKTGIFFENQTVESLVDALRKFDETNFDPIHCRRNAERFGTERFRAEILDFVKSKCIGKLIQEIEKT
ncbi:MAG: glycosyltransferase [Cyclobacteriaceae bacterium]